MKQQILHIKTYQFTLLYKSDRRPSHTSKTAEIILLGHKSDRMTNWLPLQTLWRDPI